VRSDAFSFCLTPVGKTSIPLASFSFFFKTLKSKKKKVKTSLPVASLQRATPSLTVTHYHSYSLIFNFITLIINNIIIINIIYKKTINPLCLQFLTFTSIFILTTPNLITCSIIFLTLLQYIYFFNVRLS
jgi:hypothetical protein